jgi:hypothetical protein
MFQITVVEKIKEHILCSVTFFRNRAVHEIMSKKYGGAREATNYNRIWSMGVACRIRKATRARTHARAYVPDHTHTHTHVELCNTYGFSTATMISRTRLVTAQYVIYCPVFSSKAKAFSPVHRSLSVFV